MVKFFYRLLIDKYYLHLDSFTRYRYKILKKLLIKGNINTLNIGSGGGVETLFHLNNKNDVTVIDIDDDVINRTRTRLARNNFNLGDKIIKNHINDISLNTKFDLIYICEVLEHIKNDNDTLKKIGGLLNRSGRLIISTPTSINGIYPNYEIFKEENGGHVRTGYEGSELDLELKKNGILTIKRIYLGSKTVFLLQYYEKLLRKIYIGYIFGLILYFLIPLIDLIDRRYCNQITIATKIN